MDKKKYNKILIKNQRTKTKKKKKNNKNCFMTFQFSAFNQREQFKSDQE